MALSWIATAACASGSSNAPTDARPDAPAGADAPPVDAPSDGAVDPPAKPAPLLLTEVVLAPSGGEFIEIANPTGEAAPLAGFHLSDAGAYFRLPAGPVSVDDTDFIAAFPDGATIPARSAIAIALGSAAAFQAVYGEPPAFSIADRTMKVVAVAGTASLTNDGELIALFHWDGRSDLVGDADLLLAGVPSAANGLINKGGVAIDGPDADAAPLAYASDARTLVAQIARPPNDTSTKRIALEAGHETQAGAGNGITGDDETTEDTRATWDSAFTTPTPGELPTGLFP